MKYDLDYYENLLKQYSKTAKEICEIRWDWVKEISPKTVLDYGCGVGWFRAYRPQGVEVDSYDIGAYPQTGISLKVYDLVCFYDVLEHIEDFSTIEPVLRLANYVVTSLPIKNGDDLANWKHFKPGEHLHYFTEEMLVALFKRYGFKLIRQDTPECPPRTDIHSFLFRRVHE